MEQKYVKEFFVITAEELCRVSFEGAVAVIIRLVRKEGGKIIRDEEKSIHYAKTNQRVGISKKCLSVYNGPFTGRIIPRPENMYISDFIWRSSPIVGLSLTEKKASNYFEGKGSQKELMSETKETISAIKGFHPKFIFSLADPVIPNIEKIL